MSKGLNLIIVTAGLGANLYALYALRSAIPSPGYGGHSQYLSVCGLVIATLAFFFRILNLLTGTFRGLYEAFIAVATPLEGIISVLYWALSFYQKDLVLPAGPGVNISFILDICLHLIPAVVCWVDFLAFNQEFKKSPVHILSMYILAMMYFAWVNQCFEENGYWAHLLFEKLSDMQRGALLLSSAWICSNLYKLLAKNIGTLSADSDEKVKQDTKKKQ
ncbi:unnamed protein product [Mucor hiemalis]